MDTPKKRKLDETEETSKETSEEDVEAAVECTQHTQEAQEQSEVVPSGVSASDNVVGVVHWVNNTLQCCGPKKSKKCKRLSVDDYHTILQNMIAENPNKSKYVVMFLFVRKHCPVLLALMCVFVFATLIGAYVAYKRFYSSS